MGTVFLVTDDPSLPYLPARYHHNRRTCVSARSDSVVGHYTEGGAEKAYNSLKQQQSEDSTLHARVFVSHMCQRRAAKKNLVRKHGIIISATADMLNSSNRRVRLKSLEVLRVLGQDNDDNREELGKGDTICTIV
jgi:hypothetical protein